MNLFWGTANQPIRSQKTGIFIFLLEIRDFILSRASAEMINSSKSILQILKAFAISDFKRALSFPCLWLSNLIIP